MSDWKIRKCEKCKMNYSITEIHYCEDTQIDFLRKIFFGDSQDDNENYKRK